MPKFAVMIHGVNFLIRNADAAETVLMGFYINAFLETATVKEAEAQALDLVRTSPKLRPLVANTPENPPRMFIEEVAELSDWPEDCVRPLSGFVYYDDPEAEWRSERSPSESPSSDP
jgi:hypothetical protein